MRQRAALQPGLTDSHANHLDNGDVPVVRAVSLDDYAENNGLHRIDLIKLDIEGAETEALAGGAFTPMPASATSFSSGRNPAFTAK